MFEERTVGSDDSPEHLSRFSYSNHLGSAALELNEDAEIISYEEYHPYGTTSYQAMNASINAVAKRYRYTGKERDDESGLYYHGARYYACWLARWTAVDPLEGKYAPLSAYNYCSGNPISRVDPDGMGERDKTNPKPEAKQKDEESKVGHTTNIVIIGHDGKTLPAGTKVPFTDQYTNTGIEANKKNLEQGFVVAGTSVESQPTGGAAMVTTTLIYSYGSGNNAEKLSLQRWAQSYEPVGGNAVDPKPEPVKPTDEELIKPNPKTVPELSIPLPKTKITPITPKSIKTPHPHPHSVPPPVVRPVPPMRTIPSNTMIGGAIWRTDLAHEGYEFMLNLVKELKGTNLGSIDITFGIPSNLNKGTVIHNGEGRFETINPKTKRVTVHDPMITRLLKTNEDMDIHNIQAQAQELQRELSRKLKVNVNLNYDLIPVMCCSVSLLKRQDSFGKNGWVLPSHF